MVAQHEAHVYHAVSLRQLWYSLATGAVVWSLHLIISYMLSSLACERGLFQAVWNGYTLSRWIVIGLTVLSILLVSYAGIVAYRNWQQLRRGNGSEPAGRFRFMAYAGIVLNGIFLLSILISLIPTLLMPLCE